MATTVNMNLELPTPTVTLGPDWATELNTALSVIDSHDHSSGKGIKISPAGININADLEFNGYRVTSAKSVQLNNQVSTLTGVSDVRSIYSVAGDLYFTSGAGVAVQITSGGSIVSAPGSFQSIQTDPVSTDVTISPSDNFVLLRVDSSAAREITLPLASSVAAGRIYIIQDASGLSETNPITISVQSGDSILGSSNIVISSNYSSTWVNTDGVNTWSLA